MKDFVSGVGLIAVRKRYALEMNGPVEVGEDDVDYGVGAHGEGDIAKLAHGGDHASDDPVQLVCADHQIRGAARFAVEFFYLTQRKRVGGEDVDFWSGEKDREASIRTGKLYECVTAHEVPAELFETSQVR